MRKTILFSKKQICKEISGNSDYLTVFDGTKGKRYSGRWTFKLIKKGIKFSLNVKAVLANYSSLDLEVISQIPAKMAGSDLVITIKVLMLDNTCQLKISPAMEISEHLIIAKHSLSILNLDTEEMFYLQSKGLNEKQSKDLIVSAFINGNRN